MKPIALRCAVMIAVLSMLVSCGGGSSSTSPAAAEPDFVSITVAGAGTTLYTEATNTLASGGYSPYVYVMSSSTPSISTYLYSHDWNGSGYDTRFEILVWGSGPGTYDIKDNNFVIFAPTGGPTYSCMNAIPSASGTITFTQFGSPGQKVTGTFDVISANVSSLTQTVHLTGSFSAVR